LKSTEDTTLQIKSVSSSGPIPGEKIEKTIKDVTLERGGIRHEGTLYLTNYQIIFVPYNSTSEQDLRVLVPLTCIARYEKVDKQNTTFALFGGEICNSLDIFMKDFRKSMRFILDPNTSARVDIMGWISQFIYPKDISSIFAISSCKQISSHLLQLSVIPENEAENLSIVPRNPNAPRWYIHDTIEEYTRLELKQNEWMICAQNKDYTLCDSYPRTFIIPSQISTQDLQSIASFRSKGRVPVLSWWNKKTGVSLLRCSQPRVGMTWGNRCEADEKYISLIQKYNSNNRKLHILDARPQVNAMANYATGGGYENTAHYADCELEFMNIPNIHAVRESHNKLKDLCIAVQSEGDPAKLNSTWFSQVNKNFPRNYFCSIFWEKLKRFLAPSDLLAR